MSVRRGLPLRRRRHHQEDRAQGLACPPRHSPFCLSAERRPTHPASRLAVGPVCTQTSDSSKQQLLDHRLLLSGLACNYACPAWRSSPNPRWSASRRSHPALASGPGTTTPAFLRPTGMGREPSVWGSPRAKVCPRLRKKKPSLRNRSPLIAQQSATVVLATASVWHRGDRTSGVLARLRALP